MQRRLLVEVLLIEYFSKQIVCLYFEFSTNVVEINGLHKVTELFKHICTSSRVERLFRFFEVLKLRK
jgi:hypothetical protein